MGVLSTFVHLIIHTVFFNAERKGFSKNNNFAASEAKGEFLCLLNNDCFVEGDWLLPMIEVFKQKENVGVVGNVQRLAGTKMFDHMGVVFGPQGNPRHYGQWFKKKHFVVKSKMECGNSSLLCTEREIFLEINGFDEIFINGCEDVDLCLRFNRKGYDNYVVHDSVVDHVKGRRMEGSDTTTEIPKYCRIVGEPKLEQLSR